MRPFRDVYRPKLEELLEENTQLQCIYQKFKYKKSFYTWDVKIGYFGARFGFKPNFLIRACKENTLVKSKGSRMSC